MKLNYLLAGCLALISTASAAVDVNVTELFNAITQPSVNAFGHYTLLGFGIVILLAFLAHKQKIQLPVILFVAAILMGAMMSVSLIGAEIIYAGLIVVGIIGGLGVARLLGAL